MLSNNGALYYKTRTGKILQWKDFLGEREEQSRKPQDVK